MNFMHPFLYSPDGGGGGGQGDPPSSGDLEARLTTAFNNLVTKQGGQDAAGVLLLRENKEYRDKIKELETQNRELQGKVPKEGTAVLDVEQAKSWQAYQALGKPEELATVKSGYTALQREQLIGKAAEAHQFKPGVLGKLVGSGLGIDIRDVEKDGQKTAVAFIKDGDKEIPLLDYVKTNFSDFLPSLQATATPPATPGVPFPKQGAGQPPPAGDPVSKYIEQRDKANAAKPNALMPRAAVSQ